MQPSTDPNDIFLKWSISQTDKPLIVQMFPQYQSPLIVMACDKPTNNNLPEKGFETISFHKEKYRLVSTMAGANLRHCYLPLPNSFHESN